jgi:hypothetical protein
MKRSILAAVASGALTAAAGLVWVACETPLTPGYQLTKPQVLAIQSDPVDLLPDGSVTLRALLYLPPGSPAPTYAWSWCPGVNSSLGCDVDASALTQILDPEQALALNIDYSLGSDAQAAFAFPVDPSVLQAACARVVLEAGVDGGETETEGGSTTGGTGAGRLACNGTSWTIYVLLTVGVGDASLQAVRSLTAYLTPPTSTNTNPTVVGLSPFTDASPGDAGPLANPASGPDGSVVDPGVGTEGDAGLVIAAQIPLSASELYTVAPPGTGDEDAGDAGLPPCAPDAAVLEAGAACISQVYESLDLSFYVQGGVLRQATTTLPAVRLGRPQDWNALLVNQWTPPQGTTEVILVVRDDRGGVGWVQLPVQAISP